ncbi:MAG: DUF1573 domain-containing protein [Bacteroidetes bacterium]|nr:DUF1573 domain-containing protein [Bacteroidota bacterium]
MKPNSLSPLPFLLSFLLLGVINVNAQETASLPCFQLTEPVEHHFGEVKQSATVEHTFTFRNDCTEAVEIGSVRSSCGCTSVILSDKVIPPGGEARILAKFTPPRGSRGKVSKTVSLYLKDEQKPHTVLRITADVHCDIDIQPSYITFTGATVGKRSFVQSKITNISDRDLLVETTGVSLTSYPNDRKAAGGTNLPLEGGTITPEFLRLAPNESATLSIGVTPQYVGQFNGSVGLKIGNEENVIFLFGEVAATPDQE